MSDQVVCFWGGYDYYHGSNADELSTMSNYAYASLILGAIGFFLSNGFLSKMKK